MIFNSKHEYFCCCVNEKHLEYLMLLFTAFLYVVVPDNEHYRYGLVQYSFKGGQEHLIEHSKHGNSKNNDQEHKNMGEHQIFSGESFAKRSHCVMLCTKLSRRISMESVLVKV